MKNYIGFVNDHSGSMSGLVKAAVKDYNILINSVKNAASKEMLDTVVSTIGIGLPPHSQVERQVMISNPHVLKPVTDWEAYGNTPLYDGIGSMIELFQSLPDYDNPNVSFLVFITTDGAENFSKKYSHRSLGELITTLQKTNRWTFVCRVPKSQIGNLRSLGIPQENIQEWETSEAGMAKSTQTTSQAVGSYFSARSAGSRSSTSFYADAAAIDTSTLTDITKEVSLYVVPDEDMGVEIRPFILRHRMEYLKGSAFYQLTKTEARVSHTKMIAIRERTTGKIFAGKEARQMIGLPLDRNARLHPGDHGNFDLFIQSESVNRKLVAGTGVLYWKKIGVPFTQEELDRYKAKEPQAQAASGPITLPKVNPTNKPTPSPIPKAQKSNGPIINGKPVKFFDSRSEARYFARQYNLSVKDSQLEAPGLKQIQRWFVYV